MELNPAAARRIFGSLAFRLLALLSLALMPIGAIAVFQTAQLSEQLRQRAESSVLGETFEAVEFERGVIERAYGTAETLGRLIETEFDDPAACSAILKDFIQGSERYIYSAVMRRDGILNCSSGDVILDYSGDLLVAQRFEDAKPFASAAASGRATKRAVLIIGQPVVVDEALSHFILLSIPQSRFTARRDRFL